MYTQTKVIWYLYTIVYSNSQLSKHMQNKIYNVFN